MADYSTKKTGDKGEEYAAAYLGKKRYKILIRNYRKRFGEIDIIAQKGNLMVFVEVKTRHTHSLTMPYEAVDKRKQAKIIKTAAMYLYENGIEANCRFDVCEVFVSKETLKLEKINYIENAFEQESGYAYY